MIFPNESGRLPSPGDSVGGVDLDRVWTGVAAEVWRRHPGRLERTAARLLRSPGLARALVTTPSLLLPWLISTVVVFAVADRMVLLTRVVAVFALDAVLGLLASVASGAAAALTFGWLLPMTAVSTLALAAAVAARSATVGAAAGLAAWVITVLAGRTASGQLTASVTSADAYLPYLAVAACCTAAAIYAARPERGLQ